VRNDSDLLIDVYGFGIDLVRTSAAPTTMNGGQSIRWFTDRLVRESHCTQSRRGGREINGK
jgi:hypothetical protein